MFSLNQTEMALFVLLLFATGMAISCKETENNNLQTLIQRNHSSLSTTKELLNRLYGNHIHYFDNHYFDKKKNWWLDQRRFKKSINEDDEEEGPAISDEYLNTLNRLRKRRKPTLFSKRLPYGLIVRKGLLMQM